MIEETLAEENQQPPHRNRNSLEYTSCKNRKALAAELKTVYRAESASAANAALERFTTDPGA